MSDSFDIFFLAKQAEAAGEYEKADKLYALAEVTFRREGNQRMEDICYQRGRACYWRSPVTPSL